MPSVADHALFRAPAGKVMSLCRPHALPVTTCCVPCSTPLSLRYTVVVLGAVCACAVAASRRNPAASTVAVRMRIRRGRACRLGVIDGRVMGNFLLRCATANGRQPDPSQEYNGCLQFMPQNHRISYTGSNGFP